MVSMRYFLILLLAGFMPGPAIRAFTGNQSIGSGADVRLDSEAATHTYTIKTSDDPPRDWPMWRYDENRSAASPVALPAVLYMQWVLELPEPNPAWPKDELEQAKKLMFDLSYEPVVMGKTIFVPSMVHDSVTAYDTETGIEQWRFYSEGPVRFAPVAFQDSIYFVSDDGYLYCLEAATGRLNWKFNGRASDRKVLGNKRLISAWPARGGPVVKDGKIYFASGIWPFMGIFLYALDVDTGQVVWANTTEGSRWIKQQHNADSFAGIAPQGYIAATDDVLVVSGGRSVPAGFDRHTGQFLFLQLSDRTWGKDQGGYELAAMRDWFFNGGSHECGMYDLYDGSPVTKTAATVLTEEVVYQMSGGSIQALDLAGANPTLGSIWSLPIGAQQVYCKAGSVLYAGSTDHVYAVEDLGNSGQLLWDKTITGNPTNMLAADNKLFVVTEEGYLYCFGESDTGVSLPAPGSQAIAWPKRDEWTIKARAILDCADANEGYCLVAGVGTGRLTEELVRQSDMKVIALDPDTAKVDTLRKRWQQMGLTGERVSVLTGDIFSVDLPAYLANLIVSEDLVAAGIDDPNEFIEKVFYSLRPYGGQVCFHPGFQAGDFDYNGLIDSGDLSRLARLWLKEGTSLIADHYPDRIIDEKDFAIMVKYWLRDFSSSSLQGIFEQAISHAGLANAEVTQAYEYTLLERVGPLPGSADWSHMYADASNTIVSRDALVKLPLGLLWFGGSSNTEMLPRHGHGPSEQVVAGRIFIEGPDVLRAMDVYTGRVMWERSLPNFGAHYNNTEHMPGAMAIGTNYVSAEDAVYVAYGTQCLRLAPDNGATTATFTIADPGYEDAVFGQVSIWDDLLIVGADPIVYPGTPGQENWNESCSRDIVVMNRYTGNIVWQKRANHSFQHNSIIVGNDTLYCIDRIPPNELDALSRRGIDPNNPTALWKLLALDVATGSEIWSTTDNVFGTWLGYSEEYDVLLQSGRKSRDSHDDEPTGRLITYDGSSGTVLWDKSSGVSDGPYLLHHDTIIMQGTNAGSALSLLTGDVIMRDHPITGGSTPWSFSRNYGCNTAVGSEYLLTYRSGAAGYYDLSNNGGTGNLGGFKSSCTSNLIPANGVLNVPDYTRTCTCSYQNQTSLALIHMPETEVWTFDPVSSSSGPVEKIGINFAAPGDRLADNGVLWLDYPDIGGPSPSVAVGTAGSVEWFGNHSAMFETTDFGWITATGAIGLTNITVTLNNLQEQEYLIRLYFSEPQAAEPGQRVFDVSLQGQLVLDDFDIAQHAGSSGNGIVREFPNVTAETDLTVTLTPSTGSAVICGIEIVQTGTP